MTYFEYLEQVTASINSAERAGQTAFNKLAVIRPDLASQVRGRLNLDPFHNDDNLSAFYEFVGSHW